MSSLRSLPRFLGGLSLILAFTLPASAANNTLAPAAAAPAPSQASTTVDPESDLIGQAIAKMNADDVDGALAKLTEAINLKPKKPGAYILRASIYCQRKQWDLGEADFKAALALAPNSPVILAQLAEIKFLQKKFDLARASYLPLVSDPDLGDLASYKVFLCDLYGGHEAQAKKELDVFNNAGSNGSYYFGNAAWSLYHKNIDDARGWLTSATNIFTPRKNSFYAMPLKDMGYLPLPDAPAGK